VGVGDDPADIIDHEAGAGRHSAALRRTEGVEALGLRCVLGRLDEDDAGRVLAIDLVDGLRPAAGVGDGLGGRRQGCRGLAGVVVRLNPAGGDRHPAEQADDQASGNGGGKRGACKSLHAPEGWRPALKAG
jgi:hypothetical protein